MQLWLGWLVAAVRVAGWAPLSVFSAHVAASRLLGTYLVFPSLDVPMHLLGGAAIGWFFWRSLGVREAQEIVGALTATAGSLLSLTATGTITVLWELAEWTSDRFLGTHAQAGLDDTLLDMLLGIAGGLLLVAPLAWRRPRGPRAPVETLRGRSASLGQRPNDSGGNAMSGKALRTPLLLTALVALAFAAAAGADFRLERDLALAPGGTFVLDSDAGSIDIRGTDGSGARVLVTSSRDDIEGRFTFSFEERGNEAVVRVKRRGGWTRRLFSGGGDRLRFAIEVPRRVDVDLKTAGGAIDAESIQGRVDLSSSGGSINVADVEGDVDAHTSGGSMTAEQVRGDVRLETSGGSVRAKAIDGDLVARSSGGSIHVDGIGGNASIKTSGGSVEAFDIAGVIEAHTSGGPVRASFTAGNASGGSLSSSGGGITAHVDPGVSLDLDAHSSGGRVTVDLPITARGSFSRDTLRGELNGGGALLKLRSSGGPIRVDGR